jgi:predicted O-methyltransferase YrrM
MKLNAIGHEVARSGYVAAMMVATSVFRDKPVPLPLLRFGRSIAPIDNALTPRKGIPVLDPRLIDDVGMRRAFEGEVFDEWSLNHEAINLLRRRFLQIRPDSVLEFGSGVSTVVFSHLLRQHFADDAQRLISVEQSADFAGRTETLLARAGTRKSVQFEFPGVADYDFEGEMVSSYDLRDDVLGRIFSAIQPSLIFIDGPFGTGPVRGPVLPRILPYLTRPATVILDDALRDNEMKILKAWSRLPGVSVKGISLIRKGLAEITVIPSSPL